MTTRKSPQPTTSTGKRGTGKRRGASFPAYPVSSPVSGDDSPALSPQRIPVEEAVDMALPTEAETAEALGLGASDLREEILEEEHQRHADSPGDEDDTAGLQVLADEFHRRISGGRQR